MEEEKKLGEVIADSCCIRIKAAAHYSSFSAIILLCNNATNIFEAPIILKHNLSEAISISLSN